MYKQQTILQALRYAFPKTLPVMAGYLFLGLAYGIYANAAGFPFYFPLLTAAVVYGGSLEFVTISLLTARFDPLQSLLIAVMIQARHLFYGISMLEKYKDVGWKKFFLIFGLSDETFSISFTSDIPAGLDRGWVYLFLTVLDWSYWVIGATAGGLIGNFIPFPTNGLDFVMTAMFVVILLEQWLKEKNHTSLWIGLAASLACLLLFGPDRFMIPSMICILAVLTLVRGKIEKMEESL